MKKPKLTEYNIDNMGLADIAKYHDMKETDFLRECFPVEVLLYTPVDWYTAYSDWYSKTQNKLVKALK
jgi:hypothetical protein